MKNLILASVLILAACAPAGPFGGKVHMTNIEGVPIQVQSMPSGPNNWAASKDDPWGGFIDPKDYKRNVAAIERVTGCKVIRETITNQGMMTMASVDCPRGKKK